MKIFRIHYWFSRELNIRAKQDFKAHSVEEAIEKFKRQLFKEKDIISIVSWEDK